MSVYYKFWDGMLSPIEDLHNQDKQRNRETLSIHPLGLDAPPVNPRLAARPRCLIHASSSGIELVGDKKLPLFTLKATHQLPGDNSRACLIVQSYRVLLVDGLSSTASLRHQRGGM